jgi:hypothetical protein
MPYINQTSRKIYDGHINYLIDKLNITPTKDMAGEFTYIVYRLLKIFSGKYWMRALGIGCMVCAVLEMYRVDHSKYEDIKRSDNGEVL